LNLLHVSFTQTPWRRGAGKASGDQRVLFVSSGSFQNHNGYFAYKANARVREVAYYPDNVGSMTVEYDCTWQSDRRGFLGNVVDYDTADVLVLGDSITQGNGGCEWRSHLDTSIRSRLYFAAIMGQGVLHWRNIITDLSRTKTTEKLLIIFITHDFFRKAWVFDDAQIACLEGREDCSGQYWHPIREDMNAAASARYAERAGNTTGLKDRLKRTFVVNYALYKLIRGRTATSPSAFTEGVQIIRNLTSEHAVRLIWVNEKTDMNFTSSSAVVLASALEGLDMRRCHIREDGFLPRDPHPNALGLKTLRACVETALVNW
jgi:hypothetical protein